MRKRLMPINTKRMPDNTFQIFSGILETQAIFSPNNRPTERNAS